MIPFIQDLGTAIREYRQAITPPLSIKDFSKLVGVNAVYITQIERNQKLPSPQVFWKIISHLRLSRNQAIPLRNLYIELKYPDLALFEENFFDKFEASEDDFIPPRKKSKK